MITRTEITALQGLTKQAPRAVKLGGGTVLLHSFWFALEVPESLLANDIGVWSTEPMPRFSTWREFLPAGEGEYAQGVRWMNPDDNMGLVKLISDSLVGYVHPAIYDVVMKQIPEPEFRLFPGDQPLVVILREGKRIGGTAQVKV